MEKSNQLLKHTVVCFLYVLLTLLFIYPVYLHYADTTYTFGDPIDMIWHSVWAYDHILKEPANLFDGNMFYPAKYSFIFTDHMIGTFIIFAPAYFLTKNPVLSHNILMFFLTILSGISMYFLVYYWIRRRSASFFSGFVFAFSPVILYFHPNLPVCWAPLGLIFLHRFLEKGKLFDVIIFSLIFSIIALSSLYFGYFITITTLVYLIGYYFKVNKVYSRLFFIKSLLGIIIIMVLVLPFRLPYLKLKEEYGFKRKLGEMVQYSGDPIGSYLSCQTRLYNFDPQSFVIKSTLPGEK